MASTNLLADGSKVHLTPDFFNTAEYQLQLRENFIVILESNKFFSEGIELVAEAVTLPSVSVDSIPVPYVNKNINIAGRKNFGNMTIVFRDVIAKDTELQVTRWLESIVGTKTGERGHIGNEIGKEGYKINIQVIPLSPNGDKGRPSQARGCFPINVDWGNLSYTDTGVRTFTVELAVDDFARKEVYDDLI